MNYGHTIGHANCITDFKIPHGIGVAIGILENDLSRRLNMMDATLCKEIIQSAKSIIDHRYIDLLSITAFSNISEHLRKDKKTVGNKANFTYLKNIGNMQFAYNDINEAFQHILEAKDCVINELKIE